MAFISPSFARIDRLRWLLLVLSLAWAATIMASNEGIRVTSAEISRNGGDYYIDAEGILEHVTLTWKPANPRALAHSRSPASVCSPSHVVLLSHIARARELAALL